MRNEIALAFSFLTVIPMPAIAYQPGLLGQAGRWFPLIGLLIGGCLTLVHWGLSLLFPPLLAAILITTLWAALTGGLHLDGLADCCDGLLAPVSVERRLEIMRDPRTGAFAVIGLVLFLLLKTNAIAALPAATPALLLAPTLARSLLLWVARQPPARPGGLGADFAAGLSTHTLLWASTLPLLLLLLYPTLYTLSAVTLSGLITWLIIRSAHRRLLGVTGDVYGLSVECSELTCLLVYAIQVS